MSKNQQEAKRGKETAAQGATTDSLLQLETVEVPNEQRRIKKLASKADVTAQVALMELGGTVLPLLRECINSQRQVRDWCFGSMKDLAESVNEHLEAVEARLDVIEEFGGDTQILPMDADVLKNVVSACSYLAQQLLSGPFPIAERDEEGKQKLAELIALCEHANKIVADGTIEAEEEEDLSLDESVGQDKSTQEPN